MTQAWIREAPPGAAVHAGYLVLRNNGDEDLVLSAVTSPAFARIELHEMTMHDGQMRMRRLDKIPMPAGATINLEPGGKHLMLFRATEPVTAGQHLPLELNFGAIAIAVDAEVRRKN
ncbi:MAG: copper chaperone PCu(A)C [Nevskiales bacterium]